MEDREQTGVEDGALEGKMSTVTIIIPTRNRPVLLQRAVASALRQEFEGRLEVLLVDDGSAPPVDLPEEEPRIRLIRLDPGRGGSAARNIGMAAASGRWITFLDDDDELMPGMIAACLSAVTMSHLPPPVAAVTALQVVNGAGDLIELRHPPTLPRGCYWNLETAHPSKSFLVKQSLFIEREVLATVGGFDESLRSRVHSELFLRLNPSCSVLGVEHLGYRYYCHGGPSVSANLKVHKDSFRYLLDKHHPVLRAHPKALASMILDHARRYGPTREGLGWWATAVRYDPLGVSRRMLTAILARLVRIWLLLTSIPHGRQSDPSKT